MMRRTFAALVLAATMSPLAMSADMPALTHPVQELVKRDTVAGTGAEAATGQTVTVHYTVWLVDPAAKDLHGKQFDSSVGKAPFSFPLGGGRVIRGWDEGVAGMKIGGKRTLIIPAAMAYGSRGAGGGVIPPNAPLIFDVELLKVN
jgi:FKBP-type peptidyl-prolyl cis-trans isomerase FkpA